MTCAAPASSRACFCAAAGHADGGGADAAGDLEGGEGDAAGGGGDQHGVALGQFGLFHQGAPGGDVLHPARGGLHKADGLRVFDGEVGGHVGDFAIGAPAGDVQRWDDADGVAHLQVGDIGADGDHHTGRFVAQAAGEFGFLQVGVVAEHHFGTIEAEGFDVDLDFIGGGGGDVDVFEFQDAGVAVGVNPDDACHGGLPRG